MGVLIVSGGHSLSVFGSAKHVFDFMHLFIQGYAISGWKIAAFFGGGIHGVIPLTSKVHEIHRRHSLCHQSDTKLCQAEQDKIRPY